MGINFIALGQVLFKPKKTFKALKKTTTMADGLILAATFSVLGTLLSLIFSSSVSMVQETGISTDLLIFGAVGLFSALFIALLGLFLTGFISSWLAKVLFAGEMNAGLTIGYLGYTSIVPFIFSVIATILSLTITGFSNTLTGFQPQFLLLMLLLFIFGIIQFIWVAWLASTAIAEANKTSFLGGLISYLISATLFFILFISLQFLFMLLFAFVLAPFFYSSQYF